MSEERVGGRAGTAAPQGAVCELPNPPLLLPSDIDRQMLVLGPGVCRGFWFFGEVLACLDAVGAGSQRPQAGVPVLLKLSAVVVHPR
jgi:hypothetical protein